MLLFIRRREAADLVAENASSERFFMLCSLGWGHLVGVVKLQFVVLLI